MFIIQVYTVVVWWISVITYSLISGKVEELTFQVWNIQNNVTLTFFFNFGVCFCGAELRV